MIRWNALSILWSTDILPIQMIIQHYPLDFNRTILYLFQLMLESQYIYVCNNSP